MHLKNKYIRKCTIDNKCCIFHCWRKELWISKWGKAIMNPRTLDWSWKNQYELRTFNIEIQIGTNKHRVVLRRIFTIFFNSYNWVVGFRVSDFYFCLYISTYLSIMYISIYICIFMGFSGGSGGSESACSAGDLGSISELGRSPGEGNGYSI